MKTTTEGNFEFTDAAHLSDIVEEKEVFNNSRNISNNLNSGKSTFKKKYEKLKTKMAVDQISSSFTSESKDEE